MEHKNNEYNLNCLICGTPFRAGRRHAKTCSTRCRALYAEATKVLPSEAGDPLTEEEKQILKTLQNKQKGVSAMPVSRPQEDIKQEEQKVNESSRTEGDDPQKIPG